MRRIFIFLVLFFQVAIQVNGQERHLKNAKNFIEKGTFDKAIERINTYEGSVGVKYESLYYRYLLLYKSAPTLVGLDSAITLLKASNRMYLEEQDAKKKTEICEDLQVCGEEFSTLIQARELELVELCKLGKTEEQLNWFVQKYAESIHQRAAYQYLTKFAFDEALKINTESAYRSFATRYEKSEEFKFALDSLESISFRSVVRENSVSKYKLFLGEYPQSKRYSIVRAKMWQKAFEDAEQLNTKTAYVDFVASFPTSDLVPKAKIAMEKLDWEGALQANTRDRFVAFINEYPKSSLLKDARDRIEQFDWESAKILNTIESYAAFLDKYPSSSRKKQGLAAIEKIEWDGALTQNTRESFAAFVDKYPESANNKVAMASIEKFDWLEASKDGTLTALQNFLNAYPNGLYASEAKTVMNGLKLVVPYLTANRKYKLYDATREEFVSESLYDEVQVVDNELFVVSKLGKKGLVNKFGDNITLATYDCFMPVGKKHFIFQLGSKFGLMDRKGEFVIQPIYDALNSHGDSLIISSSKTGKIVKHGILDLKGKVIVENKFRELTVIGTNHMIVSLDKKAYYIANLVGQPLSAPYPSFFSDRIVSKNGKNGYLSLDGKLTIPLNYKSLYHLNSGYFSASTLDDKSGLIDSLGQIIVPFDKHTVSYVGEGIYALDKIVNTKSNKSAVQLFSLAKKRVINAVAYEQVGLYKDGLLNVKLAGKIGYVNTDGKLVVPTIFDEYTNELHPYDEDFGEYLLKDIYFEGYDGEGEGEDSGDAGDYLPVNCYDNSSNNSIELEPLYPTSITDFSNDLAVVLIGEKFGAIDRTGKIVIPITYDYLSPFRNGIATATKKISDQKCHVYLINKSDQVVLEDYAIDTWLSNDRVIIRNREGELFDLVMNGTVSPKSLGKNISNIQRYKDYIKFDYKDAVVYATQDLVWYSDENIDFSAFEASEFNISGNGHRLQKEYNEAIKDYKKALSIAPRNFAALFGMAETYKDLNDRQEAIEYADQALEVASESEKLSVLEFKFNIYKERSDWTEAISLASQIINQFPDVRYRWYVDRGLAYLESRQYSAAIDDFTFSFAGENTGYYRGWAYNLRGVCYSRLNMIPNAVADFRKATILGAKDNESESSLGIYFNNLGNSLLSLNKKSEAFIAYKKAASYKNSDAQRTLRSTIFRN